MYTTKCIYSSKSTNVMLLYIDMYQAFAKYIIIFYTTDRISPDNCIQSTGCGNVLYMLIAVRVHLF